MDEHRFDEVSRELGRLADRRALLAGLLAALAPAATAARKPSRQREERRKDRARDGETVAARRNRSAAAAETGKTLICHREVSYGVTTYTRLSVANPAVAAHLKHGDFRYVDCCMAGECGVGERCPSGTCQCGTGPACTGDHICEGAGDDAVCCLPPGSDIQAAIDAAPAGGTVRLCAGTWTLPAPLTIGGEVKVVGAGIDATTLEATGQDRVVKSAGTANAKLVDLSLRNGRGVEGGCLHNSGQLTLERVRVSKGTSAFGGGIYNATGGTLTIDASIVEENTADNSFNVPYQGQGGGMWNFGDVRLTNGTLIERNTAWYIAGGFKNTANLLADNSSISNNTSFGRAGGLWSTETTGVPILATLNDCKINGNTSHDLGGGVLNRTNGDLPTPILFINGGEIKGNSATWGGGIFNYSPPQSIVLNGVDLSSNVPDDCAGFFGC